MTMILNNSMMKLARSLFFLTTVICCFHSTMGFGLNYWKLKSKYDQEKKQQVARLMKLQQSMLPVNQLFKPIADQFLVQPMDHFDPQIQATYKQRFWVNDQYWLNTSGPVFLYIGGEGGISASVVQFGAIVDFAKTHGALLVAAEHRFYGQSINPNGLELKNLQYLSSQQALADLASLHLYISTARNLTDNNKWFCFGGSYPGSLSAWFRIKYPHLVHGSIASSAPVEAVVNFEGYNDVVANSLSDPIVGGSPACSDAVRASFKIVDAMMAAGNWSQLSKDFSSCLPLSMGMDAFLFVSNLADVFMGTVQYNNEAPSFNVQNICELILKPGDVYQNLIQIVRPADGGCMDNSWKSYLEQLSNTTQLAAGVGMRQWIYQTCSQFGYYQTCTDSSCLFSTLMTLAPNLEICRVLFNLSPGQVYDRVAFTNAYYGSNKPSGSRIYFINGSIDPWHALSVLKDRSRTEIALVIPGTAHCADMGSSSPTDPPALTQARQKISDKIGQWLKASDNEANAPRRFLFNGPDRNTNIHL